ncbi:MAG TPA: SpoIIE family protein phosphatase [Flavobacteriales bacterium]|nr:SpoIIE family protein phosphatase [Flavobacteriales bacterium]
MELLANFILNELENLVVVSSPRGQLKYVNKYTFELLGLNPATKLVELRQQINTARQITTEIMHEYASVKQRTIKNHFEKKLVSANGKSYWILWNVSQAADGDFVGIGYDITHKKEAEIKLEQKSLLLQEQQKDVISSIKYAQRIQESVLPDVTKLEKYFKGAFVLYKPRDYVSGDFYWITKQQNYVYIAVADCTGHGVPGAMMAVMGISFLNNAVKKHGVVNCSDILYELDNEIQVNLNQKNSGTRDGMDIALLRIDIATMELQFSAAMRGAFLLSEGEMLELKPAKYPLGFFDDVQKTFTNTHLNLQRGDKLFLTTDGYIDQFGGDNDKKFNKKRFVDLISSLDGMTSSDQQHYMEYVFLNWKQNGEQTDDVTVMGIEI